MLKDIFEVCIVPLLGIITAYIVKFVNKKATEVDGEQAKKYADILANIITECVNATNQTYVDSLKKKNEFNQEAQYEAFKQTYQRVINILSEDAKEVLTMVYGDLYVYISTSIEAEVKKAKV